MKNKTTYVCGECGYESARLMGKCPVCNSWNTMVEAEKILSPRSSSSSVSAVLLSEVSPLSSRRTLTGIDELDRVLGGGIVSGMSVLLGGSPGIGKSTLLLQTAHALSKLGTVLYVSGEESKHQIRLRADRLRLDGDILLLCTTDAQAAKEEARRRKADYVIVDSVQTMYEEESGSTPGSVTQIRACTSLWTAFAKETGAAVFLVGHVTKEGTLAGPKVMEHLVDTVLYFEGERVEGLRLLRAFKNRFGSTNELGVFEMTDKGMIPVIDPSGLFLSGRESEPGCCVTAVMEGTRPLLAEIQSLLCKSNFASPRRTALNYENSRLSLLLAVLERKAGLSLSDKDAYLSGTGDLYLGDRGADLAVALSVASAYYERALPPHTAAIGEVGLTGEIRPASQMEQRIKECVRLGYEHLIVPEQAPADILPMNAVKVGHILEAVTLLAFPKN